LGGKKRLFVGFFLFFLGISRALEQKGGGGFCGISSRTPHTVSPAPLRIFPFLGGPFPFRNVGNPQRGCKKRGGGLRVLGGGGKPPAGPYRGEGLGENVTS